MELTLGVPVAVSSGQAIGRLNEIVFALDSRRVAGFLVVVESSAPREVLVMVGQVAEVAADRITLDLTEDEVANLADARQHLYVAPQQDIEGEIEAAEGAQGLPTVPDPDERPTPSLIPGIALTPNLIIPISVERTVVGDDQVALGASLRILTADGDELGRLGGVVVNDQAQLVSLVLAGGEGRTIDYTLIDSVDEDTNELMLLARDPVSEIEVEVDTLTIVATDDAEDGGASR